MVAENWDYLGQDTHTMFKKIALCPKCFSQNVLEQGYPHNHRHYCIDEDVVYWITRE